MTTSKIKFIDLEPGYHVCRSEIIERLQRVLDHGSYIMGPEVFELEATLARYVGVKHAVSCSSGTDAIVMILMALNIGSGDDVITTPHTFVATAEAIALVGARPVFSDIDEATQNICPEGLKTAVENSIRTGGNPRTVIAVDMDGLPADYDALDAICRDNGMVLIEDGAQSFGAEYRDKRCGSFGSAAATSFYPSKPLGCYGDGGMVFTDDVELTERMTSIRVHGQGANKYENIRIGLNARFDTIQAAIMLAKWPIFLRELELRPVVANTYTRLIRERIGNHVSVPEIPEGCKTSWAQYTVSINGGNRDLVQQKMASYGIPTGIYYPKPLHLQKAFDFLGGKQGDFPAAERRAARNLSLPFSPYLGEEIQSEIVDFLAKSLS